MFGWSRSHGSQDNREFKVVIYENDYKELCAWVLRKPRIETGGDLFGLWADKYSAVIQLVLGPGKGCRRSPTSFYQDVNYLEKVGKHLTQKEGVCHIGEWHSHHQLGLARPSGGDENTVWSNMPTYNLTRFVIFIANIDHSRQSYSVNVGCFLFEIDSDGKQLPVKSGTFNILHKNSPFFGKLEVQKFKRVGEEEKRGDEFDVVIKDLTLTEGKKSPAVTINQKKRTYGQGKEQNDQPQKKKNKSDSLTTNTTTKANPHAPPMTAQSQTGKQEESDDSSNTEKNKLEDPKTNVKEGGIPQQEEQGNEPLEQHQSDEQGDSKTSDVKDGNNSQEGPDKSNENEEAQNKEDRGIKTIDVEIQEGNKEEQKTPQAPDIQENQVQQSHQKQGNNLGTNVEQDNDKTTNQCETEVKNSKNTNHEIRLKSEDHQIEGDSPGANFDKDKAKPLATKTEPGENSPVMPQHQPDEQEGLKTSGHAEDRMDEQEAPKTKGDEGATQNKGTEEEGREKKEERSHVAKGKAATDSREPQGSFNTKKEAGNGKGEPGQELKNSEKQSSEREKHENDPEIENNSDNGGKESNESLDDKGKPPENTTESTKHEKRLDAKKGPNRDQEKKGKSVPGTEPKQTKNRGAKGKSKEGAAPAQTLSSKGVQEKRGNKNPPQKNTSAKPVRKAPGGAQKAS